MYIIIDDNNDRDDDFHPIFGRDFATGDTDGDAIEGDTPRGPMYLDGLVWRVTTCFCHDSAWCFSFCDDTPPPFDPDYGPAEHLGRGPGLTHAVIVIGEDILTVDYAYALLGYVPDDDINNLDHKR